MSTAYRRIEPEAPQPFLALKSDRRCIHSGVTGIATDVVAPAPPEGAGSADHRKPAARPITAPTASPHRKQDQAGYAGDYAVGPERSQ